MHELRTALVTVLLIVALTVTGCAKRGNDVDLQSQLTDQVWVAEYILGKPVIDMSLSSIVFSEDGTVRGMGGCNTYSGTYSLKENVLSFGPLATTMRACVQALGDQEMRFFKALSKPQAVRFKNGLLLLVAEDGKVSRFSIQN